MYIAMYMVVEWYVLVCTYTQAYQALPCERLDGGGSSSQKPGPRVVPATRGSPV